MADSKRWIITTNGNVPMNDIKKQLTATGFTIEQELDAIKCFTGTAAADAVDKIKSIPGVDDISPDADIDIGPPGSPMTW